MDERFTESRVLIDYGFNNFEKQKLKIDRNNIIPVVKGKLVRINNAIYWWLLLKYVVKITWIIKKLAMLAFLLSFPF